MLVFFFGLIGEFGSERLVQRVVDTILRHTAPKVKDKEGASTSVVSPYQDTEWSAEEPSKIILTGHKVLLVQHCQDTRYW